MPLKRVCSFCGGPVEPGTGKLYIRREGTVLTFCGSKCQRNHMLGRVPRYVRWTPTYAAAKGKAVAEAAEVEVAVEAETAAPAAAAPAGAVVIHAPKGKDVSSDIVDIIDRKLGPDLERVEAERRFAQFVGTATFREHITAWAAKRTGKSVREVTIDQTRVFLESAQGRKLLKDWLDAEAKRLKVREEA